MEWRIGCFTIFIVMCTALGQSNSHDLFDIPNDKNCRMVDCNNPLDMITSDKHELSSVTGKEDMDRLCPDIMQHLECIDRKTKQCMTPERQMTFNVLYNGTIVVMTELCHNESYQREYLKHARCFNGLRNEENCEATYSRTLNDINRTPGPEHRICCSFQEFLECTKRTAEQVCDEDAGEFNKRMLDTMAASLKEQCQQYSVASEECRSMSLASQTSAAVDVTGLFLLVLAGLLALTSTSSNHP